MRDALVSAISRMRKASSTVQKSSCEGGALPASAILQEDTGAAGQTEPTVQPREVGAGSHIDIRLIPTITAGWMNNRHDAIMTGIVTAEQPIERVSLLLRGEVRASARYPETTGGTQQVFRLCPAQRKDLYEDETAFEIAARTRDGHKGRSRPTIAADWNDPCLAHIVGGPICVAQLAIERFIPVFALCRDGRDRR